MLNPDRTIHNPNLLWSHQRLWLIDHGACLGFQHAWAQVTEQAPRAPWSHFERHVLRSRATQLAELDQNLATRIEATLETAVAQVPDEFFTPRRRGGFEAFLWKRLIAPRPFLSSSGAASFAVEEGQPPC